MSGARRIPWIVAKLGGSLAADPSLAHWLRELGRSRSARFVAVPGGGPFADVVRAAQSRWQFSEEVAHAMAIGAMDQFGRVLCGIELGSIPCSTVLQIERASSVGRLPVWLPGRLMGRNRELARTWDVTSDTIAAWLATLLRASGLLLVKSCDVPDGQTDPEALAAAGIIDPALPVFLSSSSMALQVVNKERWGDLHQFVIRMRPSAQTRKPKRHD